MFVVAYINLTEMSVNVCGGHFDVLGLGVGCISFFVIARNEATLVMLVGLFGIG